jgi:hypothetical protein
MLPLTATATSADTMSCAAANAHGMLMLALLIATLQGTAAAAADTAMCSSQQIYVLMLPQSVVN